ncbi:MAG TPA: alpha/beta hydrolase [Candidatus Aquilonibacter sp.]|nr:alpha/beta hydrolase [Candidatus Aquilonibacter sp.]
MRIGLLMIACLFLAVTAEAQAGGASQAPAASAASNAATEGRRPAAPVSAEDMIAPTILLWENGAPEAAGDTVADKPTLTIFRATGRGPHPAVIVAPGGAYIHLAMTYEGRDVATWLNSLGVTAFVLRYRLAPYHYPVELEDAQRAIRLVRARAAEFEIDPARVGMMGFSAGGHLTATAGTHFDAGNPNASDPVDRESSRPDFLILAYPVISFQASTLGTTDVLHANGNSGLNLLGPNPDPKLLDELSDELRVTAQTPPTFIYHCTTDHTVPVASSVAFYLALHKAGVPVEMHIFENGAHGGGLAFGDPGRGMWPMLLENWLRGRGIIGVAAGK